MANKKYSLTVDSSNSQEVIDWLADEKIGYEMKNENDEIVFSFSSLDDAFPTRLRFHEITHG